MNNMLNLKTIELLHRARQLLTYATKHTGSLIGLFSTEAGILMINQSPSIY